MALHHIITVYLLGFSYLTNQIMGGPTTFLHNWADVAISFTRIWSETIFNKTLALPTFAFALLVWFYSRIYVFAILIYHYMGIEIYAKSPYMHATYGFLLYCLYILHVYWSILMLNIVSEIVFKSKYEDKVN